MKQQLKNLMALSALAAILAMPVLAQAESTQSASQMQPPAVSLSPQEVLNRISDSPRTNSYMQRNLQYLNYSSKPEPVDKAEVSIAL